VKFEHGIVHPRTCLRRLAAAVGAGYSRAS